MKGSIAFAQVSLKQAQDGEVIYHRAKVTTTKSIKT